MKTEETGRIRTKPVGIGDGLGVGDESSNGIRRECGPGQGERQRTEGEKGKERNWKRSVGGNLGNPTKRRSWRGDL